MAVKEAAHKYFKIAGQTMNEDVFNCLRKNAPRGIKAVKKHIPGMGYVFYIKDNNGNTVAKVSKIPGGFNKGVWVSTHMLVDVN